MKKTITLLLFAVICIVGTSNAQRAQSTPIDELLNRLEQIGDNSGNISDYFTQEEQLQLRSHLSKKGVTKTFSQNVGTRTVSGNSSFTSANVTGTDVYNAPAGTASNANRGIDVIITHSNTQTIEAGAEIACAQTGILFRDNNMYRAFDLAGEFGIAGDFNVTDVEVAIGLGVVTPAGFPMTANIYSSTSQDVDTATLTLLGTGMTTILVADSETIVSIPVAATVPAGEIMVLEVVIVDDLTSTNYMRFGCNNDGETGDSWIMAPDCGAAIPARFSDLGLTQGLVMNVVGDEAGGGGGLAYCAMNATGEVGSFDPADGSVVTPIGSSSSVNFENAGSIDPADANTAYVVDNAGDAFSVDLTTGVYTALGNIPGGWLAGEFDHNTGIYYALADDTNLYTIDFGALTATVVGSTGLGLGIGLAIDGAGNAYTYDLADDSLYSIDLGTGASTLIGSIGFDANFGQGMFWDSASDTVLMTCFNNVLFDSELRSVDTATGATTLINQMDAGGLTQYAWSTSAASIVPPFVCTGDDVAYDGAGLPFDIDGADTSTADCVAAPNLVPAAVLGNGTINVDASVVSVTVDITHTWSGDLELYLVSPTGTELVLADNLGGNDDDAYNNTIFQDGGADITAATPPYNAEPYAPMGGTFAATFDGEPTLGDWSLKLCDTAGGDTGQIVAYTIVICAPTIIGVTDNTIEGFVYYPNPASNEINLSAQSNIETVVIYNILGQKVIDQNIDATSTSLDVSNLSTGTYIMKVSVDGQLGSYKIVKR